MPGPARMADGASKNIGLPDGSTASRTALVALTQPWPS